MISHKKKAPRYILGIETSCDETGVAIYDCIAKKLLANIVRSQIPQHQAYGGVIPELAAREHLHALIPALEAALEAAALPLTAIDYVAYTTGPGLNPALMMGCCFAESLALSLNLPTIPIHHMEGHLLSPLLSEKQPSGPFIALLVSGGHTELWDVTAIGTYEKIGGSHDDAVGEAFDKTAKLLDLPYPGGPALAQLAAETSSSRFQFTKPQIKGKPCDFSFSGLKTQVLRSIEMLPAPLSQAIKAELAHAFQKTAIDTLLEKACYALKQQKRNNLVVAGGVSANQYLRAQLQGLEGIHTFFPPLALCTDNGAMIAFAAAFKLHKAKTDYCFQPQPRMPL